MRSFSKLLGACIFCAAHLFATVAFAADYNSGPSKICVPLTPSTKLTSIDDNQELSQVVVDMMNEAIQVSTDPSWVDNDRPAYVWASEAKIACGKAYGYLQSSYRDQQYLDKCECFYNRMRSYQY